MQDFDHYYMKQINQTGGSLPAFHGSRIQRGYCLANVFRYLSRRALPILKHGAQTVSRKAVNTGLNVATDILKRHTIKRSVKQRVSEAANQLSGSTIQKVRTYVDRKPAARKRKKSSGNKGKLATNVKPKKNKKGSSGQELFGKFLNIAKSAYPTQKCHSCMNDPMK